MNSKERVSNLKLESDGWRLHHNGKSIKIFCDLLSGEADRLIAEKLGIELKEAWKIKHQALDNWWPKSLDEMRGLFPQIVGEDDNVKLLTLALFSIKFRDPEMRIMGALIESANSSGKSWLAKHILRPLRMISDDLVIEFTRLSGAYLERRFQNESLDRKVIFIQEAEDSPNQLYLTLSEGRLRVGLVQRVDGEFRPIEIVAEGQPFLLATSTGWRGSPDLIHRILQIELDESREQTLKIMEFESKMASDPIYKEQLLKFSEGCAKIFKWIWEETPENVEVCIPYISLLEESFQNSEDLDVKLRRDWRKFISLLMASALIFHKRRPMIKLNDRLIIIATLEDLRNVLPLVETSFRETLTGLSEKELKVLDALEECDPPSLTYAEIAKATGIPSSTLRHHIIPRLESKGHVVVHREGRTHQIERARKSWPQLVIDLEAICEKGEKLINNAIAALILSGGQMANSEIWEERALISENKPRDLAIHGLANSPAVFSENKLGEGSDSIWPSGQDEKRAISQDISLSEGDGDG